MDKEMNHDMLKGVDKDRSILNGMWQRKLRWVGHVLRCDRFFHTGIMLGKGLEIEGEYITGVT